MKTVVLFLFLLAPYISLLKSYKTTGLVLSRYLMNKGLIEDPGPSPKTTRLKKYLEDVPGPGGAIGSKVIGSVGYNPNISHL